MRFTIPMLAVFALLLGAAPSADAASCSSLAVIKAYDAEGSRVKIDFEKGSMNKFFPRPEGAPNDTQKVPKKCGRKVTKSSTFHVKASGGRLSMTQIRTNFDGKMLNDTKDDAWLGNKLNELITNETEVVVVIRPGMGKDAPLGITTVYMPITDEEKAEIARLESQAEDVD